MIEYHYFELTKVITIANQSKRKDQREEMGTQSEKKQKEKKKNERMRVTQSRLVSVLH